MKDYTIRDFQLRGNYRNFNLLTCFLNEWKCSGKDALPKVYLPTEVEYVDNVDEKPKVITVNFEETHYLCQNDTDKAKHYLSNILAARDGDEQSLKYLSEHAERYYSQKEDYCKNLKFTNNDYVVPSLSNRSYDDNHISHKGAMLMKLVQEGYPVPDFCIITSKSYLLPANKRKIVIREAISNLEKLTGQVLGSYNLPLVFAIRCAMPVQIPGLMPTYLNVGVTIKSYMALKEIYGNLVASKIYLNNLKTMYNLFFADRELQKHAKSLPENNITDINKKIKFLYKEISKEDDKLLWDPYYQVNFFINGARNFYKRNADLLYTFIKEKKAYPSLILQKMVWTVRGEDSYPGVIYTRHSRTGLGTQIESLRNIFGEEIMTGNVIAEDNEYFHREEIKNIFPAIYHFDPLLPELEKKLKSPATIEFGVESGSKSSLFAVLQLNTSELTGRATLLSTIDLFQKGFISKERVVKLVRPYHLRQIFSERIDDKSLKTLDFFCNGVSILPRTAVSARAYFSATSALEAKKRGEKVCFCKGNFIPSDTIIIGEVDAILSINPIAIHVVTACLGFGIPALIDLQHYGVNLQDNCLINLKGRVIKEGDYITISSKNKALFIGLAKYTPARFQKYIQGQEIELEEKEVNVFKNMASAYSVYHEIVNSIDQSKIVKIADLAKIIRNDLKGSPGKAKDFLNKWFDVHHENYSEQILKSELGSHLEQHSLYILLSTERKIEFFKNIIKMCVYQKLKGFTAGSFMLGRFICLPHPVAFWNALSSEEIAFLMNEFIYFEKYIMVLNDVGESNLNVARKKILTDGLGNISLNPAAIEVFIPLKLAGKNWNEIRKNLSSDNTKETNHLTDILQNKPFGYFYDYDAKWSVAKLKEICDAEKIPFPEANDI